MVRLYKRRNRYCRRTKLSDEQVLQIVNHYICFDGPTAAADSSGVSRQSAGDLYFKIAQRMELAFNLTDPPFCNSRPLDDPDFRAWWLDGDESRKEAALEKRWNESYENFARGVTRDEYTNLRSKGREPWDKADWWLVLREMWNKWGHIPRASFRYHFALVGITVRVRRDVAGLRLGEYDPDLLFKPEIVERARALHFRGFTESLIKNPL